MKKSLAALMVLLLAVLVVAGLLWLKDNRAGQPPAAASSREFRDGFLFDTTRAAAMDGLRIQYLWDSTQLFSLHGRWLTAEDYFPVDTVRLNTVRGWLLRTRMQEIVTDSADAQSLWNYGLNPEDARKVEWTWTGGDTVRLWFGKTSTLDYQFTYWKWADAPAVYRTPGNFIWDISPRTHDWREKAFWPGFRSEDVRAISVNWRDDRNPNGPWIHYRIERNGKPMNAAAEKLFQEAPNFGADDFGLELDPHHEKVRPADSAIVIRIELQDGTVRTVNAGPIFEGMRYTQHPFHKNFVWVFRWRFDYFKKRPEELGLL